MYTSIEFFCVTLLLKFNYFVCVYMCVRARACVCVRAYVCVYNNFQIYFE